MLNLDRYYRILELLPGATPDEVHQSYKDLAIVWHPDRFASHPRLQKKALYKLKEINEAHERLRSLGTTPISKASPAHSSSKPSQSPDPKGNANDFQQPGVNNDWHKEDKRGMEDYSQFTYRSNHKDMYVWLD